MMWLWNLFWRGHSCVWKHIETISTYENNSSKLPYEYTKVCQCTICGRWKSFKT